MNIKKFQGQLELLKNEIGNCLAKNESLENRLKKLEDLPRNQSFSIEENLPGHSVISFSNLSVLI